MDYLQFIDVFSKTWLSHKYVNMMVGSSYYVIWMYYVCRLRTLLTFFIVFRFFLSSHVEMVINLVCLNYLIWHLMCVQKLVPLWFIYFSFICKSSFEVLTNHVGHVGVGVEKAKEEENDSFDIWYFWYVHITHTHIRSRSKSRQLKNLSLMPIFLSNSNL